MKESIWAEDPLIKLHNDTEGQDGFYQRIGGKKMIPTIKIYICSTSELEDTTIGQRSK